MKKVVLVILLTVSIGLLYWQKTITDAERESIANYRWHLNEINYYKQKLFNSETARVEDLLDFNYNRNEIGISLAMLGISKEQMENIEKICHLNEAKYLYKLMADYDFDLESYNRLREEAKLAGINPSKLFTPNQVSIFAIHRNGHLLYRDGWRQATADEAEKFKTIEAEEIAQYREYAAAKKAVHDDCLRENPLPKYFAVGDFPEVELKPKTENTSWINVLFGIKEITLSAQVPLNTPFSIVGREICPDDGITINGRDLVNYQHQYGFTSFTFEDGAVISNWAHTEEGYIVPNYVDITDIFAKDGLKVINDSLINSHISPI